jgi:hypothetical protein
MRGTGTALGVAVAVAVAVASPHRHIATKPQPPQEELGNNSFLVRKSVDLAEKLTIYQQRQMVPLFSLTLQL